MDLGVVVMSYEQSGLQRTSKESQGSSGARDVLPPGPGKMDSKLQAAVQELLEAYQEFISEEPG